ncbi:energy transducer TonB [Aurantiacibacter zhengii]|uniref:TonB C-terminal domain-containing protein n=1 Tax=Aurantiacibacter zhengii TaxID=2307003 RepID=A0A418NSY3_9SPHN|nr:hypothetical protein [Aurantiacibacter zhengii]RIV86604.1 hypothetical protein D2V07_07790 [Aurantiacibacter zhengii]
MFASPAAAQAELHPVTPETQALIDSEAIHMPDGSWSLTPALDGCAVQREFRLGDSHVTLVMKRLEGRMPVEFALVGGDFEPEERLQAGFLPGRGGLAEFVFIGSASAGDREGVFFAGQPFPAGGFAAPTEAVLARDTHYFIAQNDDGDAVVLRTGRIDLALDALQQCGMEQLARLGVDPQRDLRRDAALVNSGALSPTLGQAYGMAMRQRRGMLEGNLPIRLVIDDTGTLAHCHAGDGLTPRMLREAVCETIRDSGEFTTAMDVNGNPVASTLYTNIVFRTRSLTNWPGADGRNYRARD